MRRCASLMTIRRSSWAHRRISSVVPSRLFFWGGMDGRQYREGQHDERGVPVLAMPGAGLMWVEAEFVLSGREAVVDGPPMPFHYNKGFNGRVGGHLVVNKARSSPATWRRINRPFVHVPTAPSTCSSASRSASSK